MSVRAMLWAWEVDGLTTTTKMVLMSLANHASDRGTSCYPSINLVAKECRLTDRAVQIAIKTLEAEGYIRIDRKPQSVNHFTLLMDLHVVAKRANEVHPPVNEVRDPVNDVRGGGERGSGKPVTEPVIEPASLTRSSELPLGLPESGVTRKVKPPPKIDLAPLVETWNAICGSTVGRILKVTPEREKLLRRAMEDEFENDPERWTAFCRKVTKSTFLTGKATKFKPDFNWMLGQENLVKILEGRYHDAPAPSQAPYAGYNPHLRAGDPGWRPSPGTI